MYNKIIAMINNKTPMITFLFKTFCSYVSRIAFFSVWQDSPILSSWPPIEDTCRLIASKFAKNTSVLHSAGVCFSILLTTSCTAATSLRVFSIIASLGAFDAQAVKNNGKKRKQYFIIVHSSYLKMLARRDG